MGHERVGRLPRTHRWVSIVSAIAQGGTDERTVRNVANSTLDAVQGRLQNVERDSGVQAAFQFLTAMAQPAGVHRPKGVPDTESDPSTVRLAAQLHLFVDRHSGSPEYAELAKRAASDAIASWTSRGADQIPLFGESQTANDIWSGAATGAGFSELSRTFFASFTERYVKYFLDREASAALPTVGDRERFSQEIEKHVDKVSRHAFETSKIAQSFAAGWFNKHARGRVPNEREIRGFLAIAFGKIREELRREAST